MEYTSINFKDAHGTACDSIVAGNSQKGIVGIAPECKLMGVRIPYGKDGMWVIDDYTIANGITKAIDRGSDVISNSWEVALRL